MVDGWVRAVEVRDDALTVDTGDDAALGSVLGGAHDAMAEWSIALAPTPVVIRVRRGAHVAAPILIRTVGATAEKAAQYATHNSELENRVRVLERIITDGGSGRDIALQIEALRDAGHVSEVTAQ